MQFAVVENLKYLTELQNWEIKEATDKLFPKICFQNKRTSWCSECGESFLTEKHHIKKAICPSCNAELSVNKTARRTGETVVMYVAKLYLIKTEKYSFQVVRNWEISRRYGKGQKAKTFMWEVNSHWYEFNSGKTVIYSRLLRNYGTTFSGSMEIRYPNKRSYYLIDYSVDPHYLLSSSEFTKNQKTMNFHKLIRRDVFKMNETVRKNPEVETLLKAGYHKVVSEAPLSDIQRFWSSLKICIRNKYKIDKPSVYFDMLKALDGLHKDLHNAHYVCPNILIHAHDYWIERRERRNVEQALKDQKEIALKNNKHYMDYIRPYQHIVISKNKYTITPLLTIEDFIKEGEVLKHCVFKMKYYQKTDSVIFSVKKNGVHYATLQFDVMEMRIRQCYGLQNKKLEDDEKIRELVNFHIPVIKEARQSVLMQKKKSRKKALAA